jgi:S1-C subfamily serine protease
VKRGRSLFVVGLVLGLTVGVLAAGGIGVVVRAQGDATPVSSELSAVEVVHRVGSAVVTVINEQTIEGFGGMQPVGSGTGFIIDADGHIVTNWHVVYGGQQYEVIFADGEQRPATLIGADAISDLAVIQIQGDVPGVVPLGDSDALQPGQPVLAIGSALGTYTNTVTQGIVSATNRDFRDPMSGAFYTNLVQHDAAINPGNSGGPLFNLSGEVVGVNTLGIPMQGGQPVQGLFFAIPSNTVATIAQTLIADGRVIYPFFGIEYAPVTPQVAAQFDLNVDHGVLVTNVPAGGPAAEAGVEEGDVILAIDGKEIDAQNAFSEVLFEHEPGETVEVTIQRGDEQISLAVTLAERPADT